MHNPQQHLHQVSEDEATKTIVALKEVKLNGGEDEGIPLTVLREIGLLHLLSESYHIVNIMDVHYLETKCIVVFDSLRLILRSGLTLIHIQIKQRFMEKYMNGIHIGAGNYDDVYKADDESNKMIVALKEVIVNEEEDEGIPPTVLREIGLLHLLSESSHIINILDVHYLETTAFLS
ncbi:hypothetical protein QVD17_24956 [Tagetes erecta]|uniref:cyclin-dependent kinase n=1 Tax=Tagetes erecta TaxID=13708 RepID=A0AAD8KM40_TARER|nr:hypothetical protein QVD17_24956 [Tagetes erecta]